ncbi:beta-ketoadipate pathway transcriptional regulator [compost metagenome]
MRALAEGRRVNVGLAVGDQLEMVYLDSVRFSRLGIFRRILPGSRLPIASTSLGCAFLAGMQATERKALLAQLRKAHGSDWPALQRQVDAALRAVDAQGYCHANWAPGMTAVALPLRAPSGSLYAMNVSFPTTGEVSADALRRHADLLLRLASDLRKTWAR